MEDKRRKAVFLDLDGTIIETFSGKTFPEDINDWRFKDGIIEKLKSLQAEFNFMFVVSNQGGIEQGYVTHDEVRAKFKCIEVALKNYGIKLDEMLFSPYNSYHYNRKPNPEFAYRMAIKYQLNLQKCIMIGDASGKPGDFSDSDLQFAHNAGMRYIDVREFLQAETTEPAI